MIGKRLLLSASVLALSSATHVLAQKPEEGAPPARAENSGKPANESNLRSMGRTGRRSGPKEHKKMNKRESFQEKHQRYDPGYERHEGVHSREGNVPKDRYQDFQEKRERYRTKQEQYRIDTSVKAIKSAVDGSHRQLPEGAGNKAEESITPRPYKD